MPEIHISQTYFINGLITMNMKHFAFLKQDKLGCRWPTKRIILRFLFYLFIFFSNLKWSEILNWTWKVSLFFFFLFLSFFFLQSPWYYFWKAVVVKFYNLVKGATLYFTHVTRQLVFEALLHCSTETEQRTTLSADTIMIY